MGCRYEYARPADRGVPEEALSPTPRGARAETYEEEARGDGSRLAQRVPRLPLSPLLRVASDELGEAGMSTDDEPPRASWRRVVCPSCATANWRREIDLDFGTDLGVIAVTREVVWCTNCGTELSPPHEDVRRD